MSTFDFMIMSEISDLHDNSQDVCTTTVKRNIDNHDIQIPQENGCFSSVKVINRDENLYEFTRQMLFKNNFTIICKFNFHMLGSVLEEIDYDIELLLADIDAYIAREFFSLSREIEKFLSTTKYTHNEDNYKFSHADISDLEQIMVVFNNRIKSFHGKYKIDISSLSTDLLKKASNSTSNIKKQQLICPD